MLQIDRESDWIANADKADDKEVEDEWDPEDDVVDDTGFVHKWVQLDSDIKIQDDEDFGYLSTVDVYKKALKSQKLL